MHRSFLVILRGIALAAILFVPSAESAFAQTSCNVAGDGVIAGKVVDDGTGQPLRSNWVVLLMTNCRTTTDSAGEFRFQNVRPGTERIGAGRPGYRDFRPVVVSVRPDDSVQVELRLRPGGPIEDCRVLPACAPLLQETAPADLDEPEQLRLAAHGAAIAIAWKDVAQTNPWYACVEDSAEIIAEVAKRYSRVAPIRDCDFTSFTTRERVRHKLSGEPGFFVRIHGITDLGPGRARVSLSYTIGGHWGQSWRCDLNRVAGSWRVSLCVMEWEA